MAFDINSTDARIAELTMEVGRRWEWEADLVESIVPNQMAIMVGDRQVGYLDTATYRIVEVASRRNVALIGHPDAGLTTLLAATGAEIPNAGEPEWDGMGGVDA